MFIASLKPFTKLEIRQSSSDVLDSTSRIILNLDSALADMNMFCSQSSFSANVTSFQALELVEIGNIESTSQYRRHSFVFRKKYGPKFEAQFEKDFKNNNCFTCNKPGYWQWRHIPGLASVVSARVTDGEIYSKAKNRKVHRKRRLFRLGNWKSDSRIPAKRSVLCEGKCKKWRGQSMISQTRLFTVSVVTLLLKCLYQCHTIKYSMESWIEVWFLFWKMMGAVETWYRQDCLTVGEAIFKWRSP